MADANSSPSTPPATHTSASPGLQDWRSKLDTQVKTYKEGFQELRIAVQQQEEDISDSLRKLGFELIEQLSKCMIL
ncbi:hypothetical protein KSP40_PGU020043 [Platanthera guangdongensis]|uniref:Uncharacterized protein n=1 Tax=Platanthera guangdongensis TaxID=2320717 RepID=A0ABR2MY08_9ASPA